MEAPLQLQEYPYARRKWRRWVETIAKDVRELVTNDEVFRQSMAASAKRKRIAANNQSYQWAVHVYGVYAAIGIRRVLDDDKRSYSLLLLVQKIANNPQVITRQSYVSNYGKLIRYAGEQDFDKIAGVGAVQLPQATVDVDLQELLAAKNRISPIVNKLIAHKDRLRFGLKPKDRVTYQHLYDAIALLDRMTCRYRLILKQAGDTTLLSHIHQKDIEAVWS